MMTTGLPPPRGRPPSRGTAAPTRSPSPERRRADPESPLSPPLGRDVSPERSGRSLLPRRESPDDPDDVTGADVGAGAGDGAGAGAGAGEDGLETACSPPPPSRRCAAAEAGHVRRTGRTTAYARATGKVLDLITSRKRATWLPTRSILPAKLS